MSSLSSGAGKSLNKKYRRIFVGLMVVWFIGIMVWYLHGQNIPVLNPAGQVAAKEKHLIIITLLLGMVVILPVYAMLFSFAWRYRESNKWAKYAPELTGNRWAETVWWGIPILIIGTLSIITWQSSHALDPHRQLVSSVKPLTIEVVALDWKWLFIYPQQNIASVNYMQFPVGVPVNFYITADAPMNSFWIPQLGSQIYAMPGMSSPLHLIADRPGLYAGSSANISGTGFAGMRFTAAAGSTKEFNMWVATARNMNNSLGRSTYDHLAKPTQNAPPELFSSVDPNLYNRVLLKYMGPGVTY